MSLQEENRTCSKQNLEVNNKLVAVSQENKNLSIKIQEFQTEISVLNGKLQQGGALQENLARCQKQVQMNDQEASKFAAQIQSLQVQVQQCQKVQQDLQAQQGVLASQKTELEALTVQINSCNQNLQASLQYKQTAQNLEVQVKNLQVTITQKDESLVQIKNQLGLCDKMLSESKAGVQNVSVLQENINQLKKTIDELTSSNQACKQEGQQIRVQFETTINNLRLEVEAANQRGGKNQEAFVQLQGQLEVCSKQIGERDAEIKKLNQTVLSIQTDIENRTNSLNVQLTNCEKSNIDIKNQFTQIQQANNEF